MTRASRDWRLRPRDRELRSQSLRSSTLNSVKERGSNGALRPQLSARSSLVTCHFYVILAALIESLFGAQVISFSAQFAPWCRRARALFTGTRLCPRKLL